jgi:hypothetical protein
MPRGERVERLIYYLFGPGRREEHTDPHIVAGWRHPAELEPPLRPDGGRDFRRLLGLLNQPHAAMGAWGLARPVWHCSMRAAPGDKMLSDDEWAQIASDVMRRTGLSPSGQDDDAVRWVAIRHGDDHIHIVAMLARAGWPPSPRAQRPVPGPGGVPGRRAPLRAAADRSRRSHAHATTVTRLCSSLGMCAGHTRALMSLPGAARRLTAVYRYLMSEARNCLAGRAARLGSCPACEHDDRAANRTLGSCSTAWPMT